MRKPRARTVVIECQRCGKTVFDAYSRQQKYCPQCSADSHRETQERWAAKAGQRVLSAEQREQAKATRMIRRDGQLSRGVAISVAARAGIDWYATSEPNISRLMRVTVPFHYCLSKNRLWSMANRGHVYMRKEIRDAKQAIALTIRAAAASSGFKIFTGKVWIDLLVQKPNHRGDAINILDTVCDAIKDGLDVDDRWFAIRRLDWEIVKADPVVYIGICQEVAEDHRVCAICGRQLPLSKFRPGRRECTDCRSKKLATVLGQKQEAGAPDHD